MKAKDLKNSILQMAVQGKLVEQDPADEPASLLLERIREERQRLIAEKKIKAPKGGESIIYKTSDGSHYEKYVDAKGRESEPVCIDAEIPFEVPESWEWVRLESITSVIHYGFTQSAAQLGNAHFLRITDIQDGEVNWKKVPYVTVSDKELGTYRLSNNDIVIARTGGTVGKAYVVSNLTEVSVFASYLIRLILINKDFVPYVDRFLDSPWYWQQLIEAAQGTGQPNVNAKSLGYLLAPLPPLAEQARIVAKIGELMPLVEQYGKLEDEREKLDKELPDRLRKSVLQMAVQGKLVPQDPADEPASVLLERIRDERRSRIAAGELKAPKGGESIIFRASDGGYYEKRIDAKGRESEPVCIDDEIPFEIPESWEWARLGSICNYGQCASANFKDLPDGTWILELEQIEKDSGQVAKTFRKNGGDGSTKHVFRNGDLLYSKLRPYLNKVVIAQEDGACTSEIIPLDFLGLMNTEYMQKCLMSPYFIDYADICSYGVKMPRLGTSDAQRALIPVPPIKEQRRIAVELSKAIPLITSQQ